MPVYRFQCKHGHVTEQYRPLAKYVERIKCKHIAVGCSSPCGVRATICIPVNLQFSVFKPFVEENMTGRPIRIETKEQRDRLCKKHKVTYDAVKYERIKKEAAVSEVSFDNVMEAIKTERLPDGTKLDTSTVVDSSTFD